LNKNKFCQSYTCDNVINSGQNFSKKKSASLPI